MKPEYLVRQYDILPPQKTETKIVVVGAGAIGSQTILCLAKMGFKDITVYDFDAVDEENISCQWYGPGDIGRPKVSALHEIVARATGVDLKIKNEKFTAETTDEDAEVLISAVDSMESRNIIWKSAKGFYKLSHFIDPRMSAEEGAIHTVKMTDGASQERYEKGLYPDGEAVQEACTAKATMYCSMLLAAQVAKTVKDIAIDEKPAHTFMCNIRKNDFMVFH